MNARTETNLGQPRRRTGVIRWARLGLCGLAAAVLWACGPVYIPVPPPEKTTFTLETITDAQGNPMQLWIAAGGPEPRAVGATYYLFDQERSGGVITTARDDGSYEAPAMPGTEGDHILINYRDKAGKLSSTACVLLSETRPTAALCPP